MQVKRRRDRLSRNAGVDSRRDSYPEVCGGCEGGCREGCPRNARVRVDGCQREAACRDLRNEGLDVVAEKVLHGRWTSCAAVFVQLRDAQRSER